MGIFDNLFKSLGQKKELTKEIMEFQNEFLPEEYELLVLIQNDVSASVENGYVKPSVRFLASVHLETSEVSYEKGILEWMVKSLPNEENWGYEFTPLSIYRVKVRKCIEKKLDTYMLPILNNRYLVVELCEKDVYHSALDKVREEYIKPVCMENELGCFTLNKELHWFEGKIDWLNVVCDVFLNTDSDEMETAKCSMEILHKLCNTSEKWDKTIREFAAKELTALANEWQQEEDDETEEITEEAFSKRMKINSIVVEADGEFEFEFEDDDMFWGHSIVVYGNISGELDRADIAG